MNKLNITKIGLLVSSIICFTCGPSSTEPGKGSILSFPLEQGNRWEYEQYYYEILMSNNSVSDTVITRDVRRIIGVDTAPETQGLIIVDDSLTIESSGDTASVLIERSWWRHLNGKIFEVAYGSGVIGDIISPVFWENPRLLLDYPLISSKRWVLEYNSYGAVNKVVTGIEDYQFQDTLFNCALVTTSINGEPASMITDWYSEAGLIHSQAITGPIYIHDGIGNIVDSLFSYQNYYLRNIDIAN